MKLFIEENNIGENILYLIVVGHDTYTWYEFEGEYVYPKKNIVPQKFTTSSMKCNILFL